MAPVILFRLCRMLLKKLTKEAHKPVLCAPWAAFIKIIGKFIIFTPVVYFNGSYPPGCRGLHFRILLMESAKPFSDPYFSIACIEY
jgi:hypothetical protein